MQPEIIAGAGTLGGAIIGGQFAIIAALLRRRNNHSAMNPHDPDDTPLREVSVGYFKTTIREMLKDDREELTLNLLKIHQDNMASLIEGMRATE